MRALGLFLVVAAGLKLYGIDVSLYAQYGRWATPQILMATIVWEMGVGLWMLCGMHQGVAWAFAIATFCVFAGISGYLGLIGQAECGCFGVIHASPWAALSLDLLALTLLAIYRPLQGTNRQGGRGGLIWFSSLATLMIVLAGVGILTYGSLEAAVAELRDEPLRLNSTFLNVGIGKPGDALVSSVNVSNSAATPIRLIGGTRTCSCIATEDLPLTIEPNRNADIHIRLNLPATGGSGQLTQNVVIWSDYERQPELRLVVSGRSEE